MRTLAALCLLILCAVVVGAERNIELEPAGRVQHRMLDRPSSVVFWRGAWWACMERDGPILYRSEDPTFDKVDVLALPGASNNGWSALAVLNDELLVCDVADRGRDRRNQSVYRVDYAEGKLVLKDTVHLRWAGAQHDVGAAAVFGGRLHLITRSPGHEPTHIFRAPALESDRAVILEAAGQPVMHRREAIQDAAWCSTHNRLLLLGLARVYAFAPDALDADPVHSTLFHAGRGEALGVHEDKVVILNRQLQVFVLEDFLGKPVARAVPAAPAVELPIIEREYEPEGTGFSWRGEAADFLLPGLEEDEYLRWCIGGGFLMVAGRLRYDGAFTSSSTQGSRRGSAVLLGVARERTDFRTPDQPVFWIGDDGHTGVHVWSLGTPDMRLAGVRGSAAAGETSHGVFTFEVSLPLTEVFGEGALPETFAVNALTFSLRENEARLAGFGVEVLELPFAWAEGKLRR